MKILLLILIFFFVSSVSAQQDEKPKKWDLSGYMTSMNSVMVMDSLNDMWITDYLLHNRLNFNWYFKNKFTFNIEVRNRFLYGDQFKIDSLDFYKTSFENDNGFADMAFNLAEGESFLFNTMIDRLWLQYASGKFEIKAGRQRINWGQTFVWNPNDIFNTYSFFDFDYPERPGSDAVRIQYYTGSASSVEFAIKSDSSGDITAAGLFKFNKYKYDVQFMGGILNSEDIVLGAGWSGNIKDMAFRGEMSYFHSYRDFSDTTGLFFISAGLDYSFSNSLYIQFEALYRQMPKNISIRNFLDFYSGPLSVKNLSFTEYNFFAQASYPISPILNGTLSVMYFPRLKGYYAGPSISYSLADNFEFSAYYQLFSGKFGDIRQNFNLGFIRFKLNF